MCRCLSFLQHPVISQRWSAWKRAFIRLFRRIQYYQRRCSGVEVQLFRDAQLSNSSLTGAPGVLVSYRISSRARQMGACMAAHGKILSDEGDKQGNNKSYAANASKSLKWRKKEDIIEAGGSGGYLNQMPQRICGNGASSRACLFTQQGSKGVNQDAMLVWENFGAQEDTIFCGVFDGHGPYGHLVAQTVRDFLPLKLVSKWQAVTCAGNEPTVMPDGKGLNVGKEPGVNLNSDLKGPGNSFNLAESSEAFTFWEASFLHAHKLMDKELRVKPSVDCFCSGTTAVTLVKQGKDLIIGNVGDSRAVLGTKADNESLMAIQLTVDLKPSLPQEAERIRQCRGRVFALQDEPEVQRVWLPHDNSPGLAMARAFGDFCLKNFGVIAVPEITYRRLTDRDKFIVLATDGVWDVLSNKQVVEIISSVSAKPLAAKTVVDAAVHVWRKRYPTFKVDDCAVVCLYVDDSSTVSCGTESKPSSSNKMHSSSGSQRSTCVETECQSAGIGNSIKDSSVDPISVSKEAVEGSKPADPQEVTGSETEGCLALGSVTRVNSLVSVSQDNDSINGQSTHVGLQEVAGSETEDWLALEGVLRVNSLVNLPRFAPDYKRAGS